MIVYINTGSGFSNVSGDIDSKSILRNMSLHNKLSPTVNTVKFKIYKNINLINSILESDRVFVKIVYDDNAPYFYGKISNNQSIKISQKVDSLNVSCVDLSYQLKHDLEDNLLLENHMVMDSVNPDNSIIHKLVALTDLDLTYLNGLNINKTIEYFNAVVGDNVEDIIKKLLSEFGLIYNFDEEGNFTVFDIISDTITNTGTFNNSNMYGTLSIKKNEANSKTTNVSYRKIIREEDRIVSSDTTGSNNTHKCNIQIAPNDYYPIDSATKNVKVDFKYDDKEIIKVVNPKLILDCDSSIIQYRYEPEDLFAYISLKNTHSILPKHIHTLDIKGDVYYWGDYNIESCHNGSFSEKIEEIECVYINNKDEAEDLAEKRSNYWKYADYIYTVKSKSNYPLGAFVSITDNTISLSSTVQITGKKDKLDGFYEYTLVGVSEREILESKSNIYTHNPAPPIQNGSFPEGSILEKIANGYDYVTEDGTVLNTIIPLTPIATISSSNRDIFIQWDNQSTLTGADIKYELQVNDSPFTVDDLTDGYATGSGGDTPTSWQGISGEVFTVYDNSITLQNYPIDYPSGVPTQKTYYFRLRRRQSNSSEPSAWREIDIIVSPIKSISIANDSISEQKIQSDAIVAQHIKDNAVSSAKILDNAIELDKLSNNTIESMSFVPTIVWDFQGTLDGIYFRDITHQLNQDTVTITDDGQWPTVYTKKNLGLDGLKNQVIRIRIKRISGDTWGSKIYYTTVDRTTYDYSISIEIPELQNNSEFQIIDISIDKNHNETTQEYWTTSVINQLDFRFGGQNFSGNSTFEIDWIMIGKYGGKTLISGDQIYTNSITAEKIDASVLNTLISNVNQYAIIGSNGFISNTGTINDYKIGDKQIYIDQDELTTRKCITAGNDTTATWTNLMTVGGSDSNIEFKVASRKVGYDLYGNSEYSISFAKPKSDYLITPPNMEDYRSVSLESDGYISFVGSDNKSVAGMMNVYTKKFTWNGEITAISNNTFRSVDASQKWGFFTRVDTANTYFMLTNENDPYGTWNSFRPISINNSTGAVSIGNNLTSNQRTYLKGSVELNSSFIIKRYDYPYMKLMDTNASNGDVNDYWQLETSGPNGRRITFYYKDDSAGTVKYPLCLFTDGKVSINTADNQGYQLRVNGSFRVGTVSSTGNITCDGTLNTGSCIELGIQNAGDKNIFIDFHNRSGTDYDGRIIMYKNNTEMQYQNGRNGKHRFMGNGVQIDTYLNTTGSITSTGGSIYSSNIIRGGGSGCHTQYFPPYWSSLVNGIMYGSVKAGDGKTYILWIQDGIPSGNSSFVSRIYRSA